MAGMPGEDEPCPFCQPDAARIFHAGREVLGLWDGFPVSPGHALLITKRHVASFFEATPEEQAELVAAIAIARRRILENHRDPTPDGFNIGINVGEAAGQTVMHLHVHVIPRYRGDMPDPRGGVRHVIPSKANYLSEPSAKAANLRAEEATVPYAVRMPVVAEDSPLSTGLADPLLPRLLRHIERAAQVDICVAFVMKSGVDELDEYLRDVLDRGGRLRVLTGDYLDATDPFALRKLLDLAETYREQVVLRVFETKKVSFHPKSYLLTFPDGDGLAFVGSSNLSRTALSSGVEWNYRIVPTTDAVGLEATRRAFDELFAHEAVKPLTQEWVDAYDKRRRPREWKGSSPPLPEPIEPPPEPHGIQQEALAALGAARDEGHTAGLVVLATGLGKTWLSAFDSAAFGRVLFVAHREEILAQAMKTYRRIRPGASLGRYTGQDKQPNADVLFASIQTLGKARHLRHFPADTFDYIVVDEFHHAHAKTYRGLIAHFEPTFMLGLTATPERTDGGDLLALCGENLVYRCDLFEGIRRGLLSPFHYYGVPDDVDYAPIPWRGTRFDPDALERAVATQARADNAFEQHRERAGARTLAFCVSQRHADFMARHFVGKGLRAVAVHSGPGSAPRTESLEKLRDGELDVLFAVDMFNEGVDIPVIDTVMMLRPTESRIVWLQQLGRGLRKAEGKERLTVIDYIGNHRSFVLKPQIILSLLNRLSDDKALSTVMAAIRRGEDIGDLPEGCRVTYDLEAIELLEAQLRIPKADQVLLAYYRDFKERHGVRPTAVETYHDGYDPKLARKTYGSWAGFLRQMGDLPETFDKQAEGFLRELETTSLSKSYKLVLLQAMLALDALPGQAPMASLTQAFGRIARRSPRLRADVSVSLGDANKLEAHLRNFPVKAWTGGFKGEGGRAYFELDGDLFRTDFDVPSPQRESFAELARELVEWRLAEYLSRDATPATTLATTGDGAELWRTYPRARIPDLFAVPFGDNQLRMGYVKKPGHIFLFVTLEKKGKREIYHYEDRFLSPTLFQWQSQNWMNRESEACQVIRNHEAQGYQVHLFVRPKAKSDGKAAPFLYCGPVRFVDWEGDKPITVRWELAEGVPEGWWGELGVEGVGDAEAIPPPVAGAEEA